MMNFKFGRQNNTATASAPSAAFSACSGYEMEYGCLRNGDTAVRVSLFVCALVLALIGIVALIGRISVLVRISISVILLAVVILAVIKNTIWKSKNTFAFTAPTR